MKPKELLQLIASNLWENIPLRQFSYNKQFYYFTLEFQGGWHRLYHEPKFESLLKGFTISPYFDARFDIVHRWFEPFIYRNIIVDRQKGFFGKGNNMSGFKFVYEVESDNFSEMNLAFIRNNLLEETTSMIGKCYGLTPLFRNCVFPTLAFGGYTVSDGNMENLFYSSALCRIVAPELYGRWRKTADNIMRLYKSRRRTNPSFEYFCNRYKEIMDYLEHYDFSIEFAELPPERR